MVFSSLVVFMLLWKFSASNMMSKMTNTWSVEMTGGDAAADALAEKYGFHNLGLVTCKH